MDRFFQVFVKQFAIILTRLINSAPAGRAALRIRPGASAVVADFVDIRLRGGDVDTAGVSVRDAGRIDLWLRSAGLGSLVQRAAAEAWLIARRTAGATKTIKIIVSVIGGRSSRVVRTLRR